MKKWIISLVVILLLAVGGYLLIDKLFISKETEMKEFDVASLVDPKPLPIPPLLEDLDSSPDSSEFHITAQHGEYEIIDGVMSETLGYNGDFLGPVMRVREGNDVKVTIDNELDAATTLHWHGLRVNGEYDGGPYSVIESGDSWEPEFTIEQPAATLWFHPHYMERTAKQIYEGLTGLLFIEDEVTDQLDIPKDYGENDFPLIIQDKRMDAEGSIYYDPSLTDVMRGFIGNTFLVNGAINSYLEVPQGVVRFRLVNGSNGRTYHLSLTDGKEFYQIASDGGLLEDSVEMDGLRISPGERAEILVDFSDFEAGEKLTLINEDSKVENSGSDTEPDADIMDFIVTDEQSAVTEVASELTSIEKEKEDEVVKTREFVMAGIGDRLTINEEVMDMDRIDEEVNFGDTEIWEVSNKRTGINGGMAHPFHMHGVQFQILDRDGEKPPANERGWKDTVLIQPGEEVRLIATFKHEGIFMYHCHILEHEDAGMMGQYEVK